VLWCLSLHLIRFWFHELWSNRLWIDMAKIMAISATLLLWEP
jgi:hypothetical protein